jgi:TetR/AcrR family transcriptional regulator, transcriptional repressor for nem operon
VIPTLSADVARSGEAIRKKIASLMKGAPGAREKKAWSLLSMMVGAMLIARAMPDKDQAAKAIDSALESALESVGE